MEELAQPLARVAAAEWRSGDGALRTPVREPNEREQDQKRGQDRRQNEHDPSPDPPPCERRHDLSPEKGKAADREETGEVVSKGTVAQPHEETWKRDEDRRSCDRASDDDEYPHLER